jgi:hypothetical protein
MHVVAEKYEKMYHDLVTETFRPSWVQSLSSRPVGTQSHSTEGIITGLRSAFGEDFLRELPYHSVQDLEDDIEQNPTLWRARYDVMRHAQYESAEAKTYFRRLDLTMQVPITYHGFLMDARGTIHIRREPLTFETVLKGTMNLRSTDPRDKIYGILGLLSDKARASIPIDYHKEPEWTFVPAMTYIIREEPRGLSILGLLWRTRPFKTPIPSWVADFTISARFDDEHNPVFLRGSCACHDWAWHTGDDGVPRATISADMTVLSARRINFGRVTHLVDFVDGDRAYYVSRFAEIQDLCAREAPRNEPLWRTLIGIRNTDHELIAPYAGYFDVLMGKAAEKDGEAQKMFQDAISHIVRRRKFFVTDKGFAGIATPMIQQGDTVASLVGMGRASVFRDVEMEDIGLKRRAGDTISYQRVVGFAYVGCHDRDEFELLQKEKPGEWRTHKCLSGELEECHII